MYYSDLNQVLHHCTFFLTGIIASYYAPCYEPVPWLGCLYSCKDVLLFPVATKQLKILLPTYG